MVVQRKWTAKGTYQELVKDSDGKNTAENVLPNVALYQFSGGEYTPASEDMAGTLGITFPYGKPQQIHVWDSLDNDEEAAAVLYHEAKHAVDPKTPKLEDTKTAKTQDLVNEKEVWMSELKYRLRQGGKALKSALAEGVVKKNKSGKYEINETAVDKEIKGYESGYLTTNRKQRFDPTKYTWTGHKKIPWPPVFPADIKKREEEFSGLESKFEGAFVERLGRKITPQQYAMRLRVHLVFVKQLSERMREYKEYDPIKDKVKGLLTQVREDVQDHVNKSKRAKLLQLIGEIK